MAIGREVTTVLGFTPIMSGLRRYESELTQSQLRMRKNWESMQASFRRVGAVGRKLTMAFTLPVIALGGSMLKTASDFEFAMRRTQVLTGANEEQFASLNALARKLGAETMFSASQAAEAMGFLAMAGFDVKSIIGALPAVLDAAAAGEIDLATAADKVSNVMTIFGVAAQNTGEIVDKIAAIATSSNQNMLELFEAMEWGGPVAKLLGMTIDQTAASFATMAGAGIKASKAGRSMMSALLVMAAPGDKARKIYEKFGISATNAAGKMLEPIEIMKQLAAVSGELSAEQFKDLFGAVGLKAAIPVVQNFQDFLNKMNISLESAGRASEIATAKMDTNKGSVLELRSAWQELSLAFTLETGLLKDVTNLIRGLTVKLRNLAATDPTKLRKWVDIFGKLMLVGPLLIMVSKLGVAMAGLGKFLGLGGAIAGLGQFLGMAALIGGVILYIMSLVKRAGSLSEAFQLVGKDIQKVGEFIKPIIQEIFRVLQELTGIPFMRVLEMLRNIIAPKRITEEAQIRGDLLIGGMEGLTLPVEALKKMPPQKAEETIREFLEASQIVKARRENINKVRGQITDFFANIFVEMTEAFAGAVLTGDGRAIMTPQITNTNNISIDVPAGTTEEQIREMTTRIRSEIDVANKNLVSKMESNFVNR